MSNSKQPASALQARLTEELARLPTINDHSHVIAEPERLERDLDALAYFAHPYPAADLQSAGMTAEELAFVTTPSDAVSVDERWERFASHWQHVRWTGFSECLLEGWRATFGIGELTAQTVGPLSEAIRAARRPGHYREVLREKANIAISLVQMEDLTEVDRELFLPMPRLNRFSMLRSRESLEAIERDYRVQLRTLDDLIGAIGETCRAWKAAGAPAVKLSQSYHRRMDFQEREHAEAERVYRTLWEGGYAGLDSAAGRVLEDYLVFACVRAATAAGLPVQFHVGPRAGTYGSLEGASLAPMAALIRTNRDARFDISHAGFPYLREAAVLAKTCANVYLNMSWIHIYSPEACVAALREWVRMVPWNKILGFGDDLYWVDTIYGHLLIARRNVATALAQLIEEGVLDEGGALEIARGLFYENPRALYGLGSD
ncbi:MAG TPA: amidohydrolase family protein [Chloroflexota bacterium]|nr:amidohydrolase family protein [Chloroflexota bacterium]